jgi:SOS response regulatory protein OraA/RecX
MKKVIEYVKLKNELENKEFSKKGIELHIYMTKELEKMRSELQKDDDELTSYWRHILDEYKYYPRYKMIWALADRIKLFYMEAKEYYNDNRYEVQSIINFSSSKRPYGNKDVSASILYSLGVDKYDMLQIASVPKEIQEWCMELHKEVVKYLEESKLY